MRQVIVVRLRSKAVDTRQAGCKLYRRVPFFRHQTSTRQAVPGIFIITKNTSTFSSKSLRIRCDIRHASFHEIVEVTDVKLVRSRDKCLDANVAISRFTLF
ncbi:unnamed protein product [Laminaria digitata]